MPDMQVVDLVNAHTYAVPEVVATYRRLEGYTDPGEAAALRLVADECRGKPILDIGVGGGRSLPLLQAISSDYRAIDYRPGMVEACKRRFPDAQVELGDARELEAFADNSLSLVVFSYNGIDGLSHEGRLAVMRSVHRVLVAGGLFLFSSHNREGWESRNRVGALPHFAMPKNPLKLPFRVAGFIKRTLIALRAERRYRSHDVWERDYAVIFCTAHDHGLMIYHACRGYTEQQLREAGFAGEVMVIDNYGQRLSTQSDNSKASWFHFVARKPTHRT